MRVVINFTLKSNNMLLRENNDRNLKTSIILEILCPFPSSINFIFNQIFLHLDATIN